MMGTMNTDSDQADLTHSEQSAEERRRLAFGKDLAWWRAQQGLSIEEASTRAGMTTKTYQRLEFGKTVRADTIRAMDALLGLTPGESMHIYTRGFSLKRAIEQNEIRTDDYPSASTFERASPPNRSFSSGFLSTNYPAFGLDRKDVQVATEKLSLIEALLAELPFPYLHTVEHIVKAVRDTRLQDLQKQYYILRREVEVIDNDRVSAIMAVRDAERERAALAGDLEEELIEARKEVLTRQLERAEEAVMEARSRQHQANKLWDDVIRRFSAIQAMISHPPQLVEPAE